MGLLHAKLLRLRGVRVLLAEPDARRREEARRFGVDVALDPTASDFAPQVKELSHGGVRVSFVTGGGAAALQTALDVTAVGGRIVVYAGFYPEVTWSLNPNRIHSPEIEVVGTMNQSLEEFHRASLLLSKGLLQVGDLVSEKYPLLQAATAFERAMSPETYRVVIEP